MNRIPRRNVLSSHAKSYVSCESNCCGSTKRKRGRPKKVSVTPTPQGPSSFPVKSDTTRRSVKRKPTKTPKDGMDANTHASPGPSTLPVKSDTTRRLVKRKPIKPLTNGMDANTHAFPGPSSLPVKLNTTRRSVKQKPIKPPTNGLDANTHASPRASKSNKASKNNDVCMKKNFVRADPSYLNTLGNAHSAWCFGAIADLVDNSMDAKATKIEISVEHHFSKRHGKEIPMLSFIDDGHGMAHEDLIAMLSFGCKKTAARSLDRIGKFGIGFKMGAMKLGRDVIVLTQTAETRSVAFLSQSSNDGKDNIELPVISYQRHGIYMDVDKSVHSEETTEYNLKAIEEFSPFNKYFIGEKLALFGAKGHGTQIYIWNLEEWGVEYCLDWKNNDDGDSREEADILIHSRRTRKRPGQFSTQVPLDYSLRAYLEVIFLNPRMKIYVQGSLVKSRPLAKSLNKTKIINGDIGRNPIQLILGRCQKEWELMNGGTFLYLRGRLIEAYKRVGGMMHTPIMGRGVIGVADVTDAMHYGNRDLINTTKQAFQESPTYAELDKWLDDRTGEYWDQHFEPPTHKKERKKAQYKPDYVWVQCEECRKWRILTSNVKTKSSSQEWFCDMPPLSGNWGSNFCRPEVQCLCFHGVLTDLLKSKATYNDTPNTNMFDDGKTKGETHELQDITLFV